MTPNVTSSHVAEYAFSSLFSFIDCLTYTDVRSLLFPITAPFIKNGVRVYQQPISSQCNPTTMLQRIIGGIYLLDISPINAEVDLRTEHDISHVVSVLQGPLPDSLALTYSHLHIDISDEESSNLLERLPEAIEFIDLALFPEGSANDEKKHRGAVLVHCAQGQSRSVAVVVAYLMAKYHLPYEKALYAVTRKVTGAQPNPGFVEQLELFESMNCALDTSSAEYRRFLVSNSLKQDPSGSQLATLGIYKHETQTSQAKSEQQKQSGPGSFRLRCKRCRQHLAAESDLETHDVPGADSRQSKFIKNAPNSRRIVSVTDAASVCSHYFMGEPLDWMQCELAKQEIEGKFACPKCDAKVGGYSWRGSRCSCGKWMIPALHLQAAKVDEMKVQSETVGI